jgi:hypothetical protein
VIQLLRCSSYVVFEVVIHSSMFMHKEDNRI